LKIPHYDSAPTSHLLAEDSVLQLAAASGIVSAPLEVIANRFETQRVILEDAVEETGELAQLDRRAGLSKDGGSNQNANGMRHVHSAVLGRRGRQQKREMRRFSSSKSARKHLRPLGPPFFHTSKS
jgi:hypothetical protein